MQVNKQLLKTLNWRHLLLENYRDLLLDENQVMIILMCDYCISNGEKLVTPEILSLKMSLKYDEIDKLLTGLMSKGFILIKEDENGHMYTSLDKLVEILSDSFVSSLAKSDKLERNGNDDKEIFDLFENKFGRPLSYIELQTIQAWLDEGCSKSLIVNSLNEALVKKAFNIRYVDQIILNRKKEQEAKNEGYSTISDDWRHDIEETIKISSLDWIDEDDENK